MFSICNAKESLLISSQFMSGHCLKNLSEHGLDNVDYWVTDQILTLMDENVSGRGISDTERDCCPISARYRIVVLDLGYRGSSGQDTTNARRIKAFLVYAKVTSIKGTGIGPPVVPYLLPQKTGSKCQVLQGLRL